MAQLTGEYPRPISRPVWLTARARNAVHRPVFIGAVGIGTFALALGALFLAPQQVRHPVRRVVEPSAAPPDTAPLVAALTQARSGLTSAEASLTAARTKPSAPVVSAATAQDPSIIARRDTLSGAVNDLDALLARVETAPVPATYRALGESPQLSANVRMKALLDSLSDVERDRDAFGSAGGADPVFVALTARATEIGRAIQAIAQDRRDALRQQVAKINAPAVQPVLAQAPSADTSAWIAARDSAQSLVVQASTALTGARAKIKRYDSEVARASEDARVDVPPIALLGAALVFGIALGFGSAFVREMRHPRISSEQEVERMTGARVLAIVRPRPRLADRDRRYADHDSPPYFDPAADGYQLTFLHVARAGASRMMLTIAAEDAGIAGVIAINVAAIAADEARSTILIDTYSLSSPVAAVLRSHAEPGLADVVAKNLDWADVTTQALVGRDRVIDVMPSGLTPSAMNARELIDVFRRESGGMTRHYEAIIVVASLEHARAGVPGGLPIRDTIVCARIGHTKIADLQTALTDIRSVGGNAVGVVLWDAPPPSLPRPSQLATAKRPIRTSEMQAITTR